MYAYDADCIVFGGGFAHGHPLFGESMKKALAARYPYTKALESLKIEYLPQGDIPVLGAAKLKN